VGYTDPFTQFYPTGFTQWVKHTMPTLAATLGKSFTGMGPAPHDRFARIFD